MGAVLGTLGAAITSALLSVGTAAGVTLANLGLLTASLVFTVFGETLTTYTGVLSVGATIFAVKAGVGHVVYGVTTLGWIVFTTAIAATFTATVGGLLVAGHNKRFDQRQFQRSNESLLQSINSQDTLLQTITNTKPLITSLLENELQRRNQGNGKMWVSSRKSVQRSVRPDEENIRNKRTRHCYVRTVCKTRTPRKISKQTQRVRGKSKR